MTIHPQSTASPHIIHLSAGFKIDFEDAWYDAVNTDHFWMRWRNRVFLSLIRDIDLGARPLRVLEIGCGNGIARLLIEQDTNWTVDAADVNGVALEMASPGRGETLLYDIFDQAPDRLGRYDAVILFDVIEHIENPQPFLKAAAAHLRPGGHLFVNVPALQSFYSVFDKVMGHHRRYNKQTLLAEISAASLRPLACRYWGLSLLPALAARTALFGHTRSEGTDSQKIAKAGVTPPNRLAAGILDTIGRLETAVTKSPPLGTSVMVAAQRMP